VRRAPTPNSNIDKENSSIQTEPISNGTVKRQPKNKHLVKRFQSSSHRAEEGKYLSKNYKRDFNF
jgi:hypothetical protein